LALGAVSAIAAATNYLSFGKVPDWNAEEIRYTRKAK
jgi:hypothetical protein